MTAIAATSPLGAYQREATRLAAASPRVGGKRIERDTSVTIGPFSVRYTATDYEFDLSGLTAQASFADALDAAATAGRLADTAASAENESPPNALTRRQALASYTATAALPAASTSSGMFSATV